MNESDRYNETLGQAVNMKSQPDTAVRTDQYFTPNPILTDEIVRSS